MSSTNKTLGELIEHEVRKQGIPITSFADMICCQRANVYNLFQRGDKIDVAHLKLISKVLGHNFFEDLAKDEGLINLDNSDINKDITNSKAVSQFMETMPTVLTKLGVSPMIMFCQLGEQWGTELPDFGLADIPVSFTIGQRIFDKMNGNTGQFLSVESYQAPNNTTVDAWLNTISKSVMLDIPIVFHTEEEWLSIMDFAINKIQPIYGAMCSYGATRIDREIAYQDRIKTKQNLDENN